MWEDAPAYACVAVITKSQWITRAESLLHRQTPRSSSRSKNRIERQSRSIGIEQEGTFDRSRFIQKGGEPRCSVLRISELPGLCKRNSCAVADAHAVAAVPVMTLRRCCALQVFRPAKQIVRILSKNSWSARKRRETVFHVSEISSQKKGVRYVRNHVQLGITHTGILCWGILVRDMRVRVCLRKRRSGVAQSEHAVDGECGRFVCRFIHSEEGIGTDTSRKNEKPMRDIALLIFGSSGRGDEIRSFLLHAALKIR